MSNANLLTIFNDHFVEFITDIHNVFPEDPDILTGYNISFFDETYIYKRLEMLKGLELC